MKHLAFYICIFIFVMYSRVIAQPVAVCNNFVNVSLDNNGEANLLPEYIDDSSYGYTSLALDKDYFDCNDIGSQTVTLFAINGSDTASCTSTVMIEDKLPPIAVCDADVTIQLNPDGTYTLDLGEVDDGSYDNCALSLNLSQTEFDCGDEGNNFVYLTAEDPSGNTSTCFTEVTVEKPVAFSCPPDIAVTLGPGGCELEFDPGTVICEADSVVYDPAIGTILPIGTHPIQITAYMDTGILNCAFDLIVEGYPNPTVLACNNLVYVSVPEGGSTEITADMLLEGGPYGCYDSYEVEIEELDGTIVPNNIITDIYEGDTLNYTVTDTATNNSCWGKILVFVMPNCDTFFICDTEPHTAPVGTCDSNSTGHSLDDNVEWPADVTASACDYSPDSLINIVGIENAMPEIDDCNNSVAYVYEDIVIPLGGDTLKVIRKWTVLDWITGNVWEYIQILHIDQSGNCPIAASAHTWYDDPIEDVEMIAGWFTDSTGNVDITGTPVPLTLAPVKADTTLDRIDILDLIVMRLIVLGLINPDPYQYIAGDMNGDGGITTFDFVLLSQILKGIGSVPEWEFFDANASVPGPPTITVNSAPASEAFIGVKYGDVFPLSLEDIFSNSGLPPVNMKSTDQLLNSGETYTMQLKAHEVDLIVHTEMQIEFLPDMVEILSVSSPALTDFNADSYTILPSGKIALNWNVDLTTNGQAFSEEDVIFNIEIKAKEDAVLHNVVAIPQNEHNIVVADATLSDIYTVGIEWENQIIIGTEDVNGETSAVNVFPNPMQAYTRIEVEDRQDELFTFKLYNTLGVQVTEQVFAGSFDFYSNHLSSGAYHFTVSGKNGFFVSGKLVKM